MNQDLQNILQEYRNASVTERVCQPPFKSPCLEL
jgi:hypothetical protein